MDVLKISAPVGRGETNSPDDVNTIITLLNGVPASQGGPDPQLNDPTYEQLFSAITKFQRRQFGSADGVIDPGRQTIGKLNRLTGRGPQVSGTPGSRLVVPSACQYYQGSARWKLQTLNYTDNNIWAKGCALTAATTLFAAKGFQIPAKDQAQIKEILSWKNSAVTDFQTLTPATMEAWMTIDSQGYARRSPDAADLDFGYISDIGGGRITFVMQWKAAKTSREKICRYLDRGNGILAHIDGHTHWIVLTGYNADGDFTFWDVGYQDQNSGGKVRSFDELDLFCHYTFA
jgi:hypothetical protein